MTGRRYLRGRSTVRRTVPLRPPPLSPEYAFPSPLSTVHYLSSHRSVSGCARSSSFRISMQSHPQWGSSFTARHSMVTVEPPDTHNQLLNRANVPTLPTYNVAIRQAYVTPNKLRTITSRVHPQPSFGNAMLNVLPPARPPYTKELAAIHGSLSALGVELKFAQSTDY